MDAEPLIVCDGTGLHRRMTRMATASLLLYGGGVPAVFALTLFRYRAAIRADQRLRQRCEGEEAATNPNLHVRR
jgi:hypothetical protein